MNTINIPGFNAESSLGPTIGRYQGKVIFGRSAAEAGRGIIPQQRRFQSDPDLGAYLRCRANGGGDLICRFFAGLPPFTIGSLLTWA